MAARAAAADAAQGLTRYHFLDGLRGMAALLVVLHHFSITSSPHRFLFGTAPLAVDFFFCLSGFVLAHAYQERLRRGMSAREYMLRRLVRLYPMYVAGGVLGLAALLMLHANNLTDFTPRGIASATALHLLYIPFFNGYTERLFDAAVAGTLFPLNNPAWSLFFELAVASTLYAWAARHRHAPAAIAALSAIALVVAALRYGSTPGWGRANFWGGLPRVTYAFFMGVLVFQHRHRLARLGAARPVLLVAALAVLCGLPRMPGMREFWLAAALVAVPLIVAAATTVSLHGAGARRLADYAGRLSYPLYCVHYPLLMLLAAAQWRPAGYMPGLLLFAAASVVVSHLLLVLFDEPLRRRLGQALFQRPK